MSNQVHVQNLRGDTAKNNNYLGKEGELVVNLDSHSIRVHDGITQGGHGTVYTASSETDAYIAMHDLAEGALVIVGTAKPYKLYQKIGSDLVEKELAANVEVSEGTIKTEGSTGVLEVRRVDDEFLIDATFPEATVAKGEVKTEGNTGSLNVVKDSTNNFTVSATFPEATVTKGTATTSGATGDIEIVRNSVNNYTVNATFPEATIATGEIKTEGKTGSLDIVRNSTNDFTVNATFPEECVYAAHTDDAEGTDAILPSLEEGALIVEGTGGITVTGDVRLSATTGNTLERKSDGLYNPKSAVITANSDETEAVLPNLAEGALIVEGPGDIIVETTPRVSSSPNNAIYHKGDGIFAEAIRFGTDDIGVGASLPTGAVYIVYEE